MTDLTNHEVHWLRIFAKESEFFSSLLEFYYENDYLTRKQHYYLRRDIEKAEEEGDTLLTSEELIFLHDHADDDEELMELLEIYEDKGFLEEYDYNNFINLKNSYLKKGETFGQIDLQTPNKINSLNVHKSKKIDPEHIIIRIPCPHCSFLCSSKVKFCGKCGEPLLRLKESNKDNLNKNPELRKFKKKKKLNDFPVDNLLSQENILKELSKDWIGLEELKKRLSISSKIDEKFLLNKLKLLKRKGLITSKLDDNLPIWKKKN